MLSSVSAGLNRRRDGLFPAIKSGSIAAARLAPRFDDVTPKPMVLDGKTAALPDVGVVEVLVQLDDAACVASVADLGAVVARGAVHHRPALLQAGVKPVGADGDDLTLEDAFALVRVAGSAGATERWPKVGERLYDADGMRPASPAPQPPKQGRENPATAKLSLPS